MVKEEGILDNISTPEIDITDWRTVFESLKRLDKNIIVENEKASDGEIAFVIGKIIKFIKTKVVMQHFDVEGIWEKELCEIPFSKITSVSFSTRYVEVFSKYI